MLPTWIPTLAPLVCLALAFTLTRQRGQAWRVGAIAALGPLGGVVGWGLSGAPDVGLLTLATSALAAALGAGLGLVIGPVWNLRRSWGVPLALTALSLELAALTVALGLGRVSDHRAALVLLVAGSAAGLSALRVGTTPQMAAWTRGLRGVVIGLDLLGVGAFWAWQEQRALALAAPLDADLLGNAAAMGAWALTGAAVLGGVLWLGRGAVPWVPRLGAALLLGGGLLLPLPVLAMRWANARACDAHLPQPISVAERLEQGLPDPIEIPQGWCRAPLEPNLECPRTPTLYTLDGNGWIAQRTEQDPNDSLWGHAWRRRGGINASKLRDPDLDTAHLGRWLVSGGNREPMDLDGTLQEFLETGPAFESTDPRPPAIVRLEIDQFGRVVDLQLDEAAPGEDHGVSAEALAFVFSQLDFPVSACPGTQELVFPYYRGAEADEGAQ